MANADSIVADGSGNWVWEEGVGVVDREFGDFAANLRSMVESAGTSLGCNSSSSSNSSNNILLKSMNNMNNSNNKNDDNNSSSEEKPGGEKRAKDEGERVGEDQDGVIAQAPEESKNGVEDKNKDESVGDSSSSNADNEEKKDEESSRSGAKVGVLELRSSTKTERWPRDQSLNGMGAGVISDHLAAVSRMNELGADGTYGESTLGRGVVGNMLSSLDRMQSPSSGAIANHGELLQDSLGSMNSMGNAGIANTSAELLLQQQKLISQLQRMIAQQQAQLNMTAASQNSSFSMASQMSQAQPFGGQDAQLNYPTDTSYTPQPSLDRKPPDSAWLSQSSASLLNPHDRAASTSSGLSNGRISTNRHNMDLLESSSFMPSQLSAASQRQLAGSMDRNLSLPNSDSSTASPSLYSLNQLSGSAVDGSLPMAHAASSWGKSSNQLDNSALSSSDIMGSMDVNSLQSQRRQQTPDTDPLRSTIYQAMQQTSSPGHLSQMTSDLISLQLLQMQQQQQQLQGTQKPTNPNSLDTFSGQSSLSQFGNLGNDDMKGFTLDNLQNDYDLLRSKQEEQLLPDGTALHKGKRRRSGDRYMGVNMDADDSSIASQRSDRSSSVQGRDALPGPIQISFLDGPLAGGWQFNTDMPDRRRMLYRITKLLERMRPNRGDSSENLHNVSRKIEENLYRTALTKEAYLDLSTLKQRLQNIAINLGVTNAANASIGTTNRSGSLANNFGDGGMSASKSIHSSLSLDGGGSVGGSSTCLDQLGESQQRTNETQDRDIVFKQDYLDGHFTGGWQSNSDLPDRRRIVFTIIKVIQRMRPNPKQQCEKLPVMAKKLEELLYRAARTKREYTDLSTLKLRLQKIAQVLGVDQRIISPQFAV